MSTELATKRRWTAVGTWDSVVGESLMARLGTAPDILSLAMARTPEDTERSSDEPWGSKLQHQSYTQIVVEVKGRIRAEAWNWLAMGPVTPTAPLDSEELAKAFDELNTALAVAANDPRVPPEDFRARAKTLLQWMYDTTPFPYDVRPEKDGGISIHAIGEETYILIILSPNQPDKCFVNTKKAKSRIIFKDRHELFGKDLRRALLDLRDSEYPIVASTTVSLGQHAVTAPREVAGLLRG